MAELDAVLQRQLRRLGITEGTPPTETVWRKFVQRVGEHYTLLEDNRALLVRSMEVSTREMNELKVRVEGQRDELKEAIFALNETLLGFASILQESSGEETGQSAVAAAKQRLSDRISRLFPESEDRGTDSAEATGMKTTLLRLADQLLRLLASSVETLRLRKEVEVTRVVQEMLVPARGEGEHADLVYAAEHASAESCGGDFWLVQPLDASRTLVFVADATGHGVPSALLIATVKGAVETLCEAQGRALDPREFMRQLDGLVARVGKGRLFVTATAALFDRDTRHVVLVGAGHPFPLVCRAGEARSIALHGAPLGSGDGERARDVQTLEYEVADTFCWFTDGLVEAEDERGEQFSERRLRAVFQRGACSPVPKLRETITEAVGAFRGQQHFDDDRTLVVATMR